MNWCRLDSLPSGPETPVRTIVEDASQSGNTLPRQDSKKPLAFSVEGSRRTAKRFAKRFCGMVIGFQDDVERGPSVQER